ncbi:hypothetical protein TM233_58960 [Bradyrhizobium sp. TM233]|nr:hypothetical protein TM233_58960 [Bradyrhizobium sp. TM233]
MVTHAFVKGGGFRNETGDPSRSDIANDRNDLDWQIGLTLSIEPKAVFGTLANGKPEGAPTAMSAAFAAALARKAVRP